ncbi:Eukaryotic translation initiation factor 5 [Apostasia shenzhenica]|uniref:Eukaryotic translation initiation factor 5 n=1 Tax=Apostasia shenzhenica TaxID=1088818 RepID=A0A2I0B3D9_9ASPA|nr:Eukaryotic translation initiation factor 5 [Apostasia shenzhenica]
MLLLRAPELFCDGSGDAVKEVSLAVKALYKGNVVQDEIIFQWYKDGILGPNKNSRVWKNMKPFMECFATHYWCNQELSDLLNEPQE